MAYEYEKFVLSLLTSLAIKKENKGYYVISDEVEDVYDKARAFDKIRNLDKDFYEEYGYSPNEEEWWYEANNIFEKYEGT